MPRNSRRQDPDGPAVYAFMRSDDNKVRRADRRVRVQVDRQDARNLCGFRWWILKDGSIYSQDAGNSDIRLAAYILGSPPGKQIWYRDGNPLNCRRANLTLERPDPELPVHVLGRQELLDMSEPLED